MKDLHHRVDKVRRELDELIVALAAKAKANDHHPNFPKKEACDNAALSVQKANNELYYAELALMG